MWCWKEWDIIWFLDEKALRYKTMTREEKLLKNHNAAAWQVCMNNMLSAHIDGTVLSH